MRTCVAGVVSVLALGLSGVDVALATPQIGNAALTTRAVASTLDREMSAVATSEKGVVWVGYAVPATLRGNQACCTSSSGGGWTSCGCCRLEWDRDTAIGGGRTELKVSLEAAREVSVLARFEGGALQRIAAYAAGCEIDAGGRRVVWLTGVKPDESVAWLASVAARNAEAGQRRGLADGAMLAITFHAASSSDRALVDLARNNASPKVRSQALFWLAQKAGAQVASTITDAINNDPDTAVKRQAVFALSQLPKDEGVPLMIQVARTNRNPEVRKQAMFWLGQSKDARALAFFEEILTK
jgi:hypothetical protein